jgi:hypothetical protein
MKPAPTSSESPTRRSEGSELAYMQQTGGEKQKKKKRCETPLELEIISL